ncbi:hypothetical protein [Nonomuraea longicatena]|uniref:Uncharacterized protein n=1 Tax=Nonomuraea longicatena TaxID=83682 RepID=A0ABN1PZX0_9ACTN
MAWWAWPPQQVTDHIRTILSGTVDDTALQPPEPGSVEAAVAAAGLGLSVADLRRARPETGPDRIRIQSAYVHTPVLEAFDGVLSTPASTVADVQP